MGDLGHDIKNALTPIETMVDTTVDAFIVPMFADLDRIAETSNAEALEKAERAAAGESLSSSESDVETDQTMEDEERANEPTPLALEPSVTGTQPYTGLKSMASAARNPADTAPVLMMDSRRPSSTAISSRSSRRDRSDPPTIGQYSK